MRWEPCLLLAGGEAPLGQGCGRRPLTALVNGMFVGVGWLCWARLSPPSTHDLRRTATSAVSYVFGRDKYRHSIRLDATMFLTAHGVGV